MRHVRRSLVFVVCSVLLLVLHTAAWAQSVSTAQINGAVKDEGGLALPGVTVTVTQTDTGLTRNVVTDGTGSYILQNLPIGPYKLEATLQGFRTFVQTGIVLQVNGNPTLNIAMQIGQLEETVTVEGSAPLVETRNPGIGQVVTNEQVVELPLNGRQLTQLILTAGMASADGAPGNALSSPRSYPSIVITVAGGLANGMAYILDGSNHNDPYNNLNLPLPFPDAMQEFKVETSALPAQYGQHAAAAVNAVTKSGTNVLHGDAFEFMRDHSLNAANAFAKVGPDGKRADDGLHRDQFGGTLGGPIVSGKLFYFGGYQGTIVDVTPSTFFSFVPTEQMLRGDFSTITSPACNSGRTIALRAPFVGTQINPALFSPIALNVTKQLPKTSDPCGRVDYSRKTHTSEKISIGRIDYQGIAQHTIFGRYQLAQYDSAADYDPNNILAYSLSPQNDTVHSVSVGDTWVFGANAVNSVRLGYNNADIQKPYIHFFDAQQMGVKNIANLMPGHMRVSVSGAFSIGGSGPGASFTPTQSTSIADDYSFVKGAHQIAIGGTVVKQAIQAESYVNAPGTFTFNGSIAGQGFADFLLGRTSQFQQGMVYKLYDRSLYNSLYIQDAWRLSPRLTANIGLRWEPYHPYTEDKNQFSHFDMDQWANGVKSTVYKNAPKGVIFSGDPGYPGNAAGFNKPWNFAPRTSLAWDLLGDGRSTIRAAWGRFYDLPHLYAFLGFAVGPPIGSVLTVTGASLDDPYANVIGGNPFPIVSNPDQRFNQFANWLTFPLNMKPWYSDQWNVSFQKQLGAAWALAVNYANARGHHLPIGENLNPAIYQGATSTVANVNPRRKLNLEDPVNGQYYGLVIQIEPVGESKYDALLLSLQHRASKGLTLTSNYTLSKCTSDLVDYEPAMAGRATQQLGNPAYDRGSCGPTDRRHVANLSAVYQLPQFSTGAVGKLTNDWQVSAIVRAQSGNHFEVLTGVDNALSGNSNQRATQVMSDPYLKKGYQWLNPAAFGSPAPGTLSPVPIQSYQGPGTFNVDMGLTRSFPVGGKTREIQLRAEIFNVFNMVELSNPSATLSSTTFGFISSTSNDARIVQLALKYAF